MKKLIAAGMMTSLLAVSLVGCGGGGGSTAAPVSTAKAKNSAQKSVAYTADLDNALGFQNNNYAFSSARRAGKFAATVTETDNSIIYSNEVDPDTGCTQNGTISFTNTSNTTASISGSIVTTSCDSAYDNGTYAMSGSMAVASATTANVSMTTTFSQSGSTLKITAPIAGTVGLFDDSFTQTSANAVALNGTDIDGYTYTSFVLTDKTTSVTISGKIADASGFYMVYSNTTMYNNGSGSIKFATSDGVTGSMTLNADGSGNAALVQSSDGAALLTITWGTDGAGTITYADNTTESVTLDV